MEGYPWLGVLLLYSPTAVATLPAALLACRSRIPWRAFAIGFAVTIASAAGLGVAADQADRMWRSGGGSIISFWSFNLLFSPFVALPLGAFCAARVKKRDQMDLASENIHSQR